MSKKSATASALSLETGMLAFARSVQITEGAFTATMSKRPDAAAPVEILEKGVRGQSSEDNAKNPGKSNPQSVEYAVVPQGYDGVRLTFSAQFLPFSMRPHACGDTSVADAYARLAEAYRAAGGFDVIARLYVWNIANARFAWRNRYQSDDMKVTVTFEEQKLVFDPFLLNLDVPATRDEMAAALVHGDAETLDALIAGVAEGLSNKSRRPFRVCVALDSAMEAGQEIFPSQEYVRDEKNDKQLSRVLAKLPTYHGGRAVMQASMHAQKIGAALRHIDIWHGDEDHAAPIAVNPYGGVQETGAVLRNAKTKMSFYNLRSKAAALIEGVEGAASAAEIDPAAHFVMANLIRGGVFGASSKAAENKE